MLLTCAELRADIPGGAVEERIARREHDRAAVAGRLDPLDEFFQARGRLEATAKPGRHDARAGVGADEHLGLFDEPAGLGGHALHSVIADPDDVNLAGSRQ